MTAKCGFLSLIFIFQLCAGLLLAQSQNSDHTLKLDDPANMPPASAEDFGWMEGYWVGKAFGGVVEEVWSAPSAGSMMGMFRLIKDGKVVFYELQLLSKEGESMSLKVKHFNEDFSGWEEKDENVSFPLVKQGKNEAYFSGLTYHKTHQDSINIYLVLNSKKKGRWEEAFNLVRHKPTDYSQSLDLRTYGVKIKVADMDKAIQFYNGALGFEIESRADYPNSVSLRNEGMPLILSKAASPKMIDFPNVEQTSLTFQANDLVATIKAMKDKGVDFIQDQPFTVGIGIAAKFRDPFGNVHSLLEQQVGDQQPFQEPRIYNVGFYLEDLTAARKFYCDKLGFVVRTEKYHPAIPLGHEDGSFAFMLHGKEGVVAAGINYATDTQTLIMYETQDLSATMAAMKQMGVQFIHQSPQASPQGRYAAFLSPVGLASEIVERSPLSAQK